MKRFLSILFVAICLFNVSSVEASTRGIASHTDDMRLTESQKSFPTLDQSEDDSSSCSHDSQQHSDGDCGGNHHCHLGHCSFILASAVRSPVLTFKTIHFSPINAVYASGVVRRVARPPQI